MSDIANSLSNIRLLEDFSRQKTVIHRLHPLIKLLTTVCFLMVVVSFDKYDVGGMLPLLLYPTIIFTLAELPVKPFFLRMLLISPFILGIGLLNPIFDDQQVLVCGREVSRGWITFASIVFKGGLTVSGALLLIATTGIEVLGGALRMLRVPRIFVLQLLLTYRYIAVLMEEVARTLRAYSLRAPGHRGICRDVWGSLVGQLILRTIDRAQRIYEAMRLRGFEGEYNIGVTKELMMGDFVYFAGWLMFFILVRMYNIPILIGAMLTGVMR